MQLLRIAYPALLPLPMPCAATDPAESQTVCGHIRKNVAAIKLNNRLQTTDPEDSRRVVSESRAERALTVATSVQGRRRKNIRSERITHHPDARLSHSMQKH